MMRCCERSAWSDEAIARHGHSTYCLASGRTALHTHADHIVASECVALLVNAVRAGISLRYTASTDGDGWIGAYDQLGRPLSGGQCHRGFMVFECLKAAFEELERLRG